MRNRSRISGRFAKPVLSRESGTMLIETMIAAVVLMVGLLALMGLLTAAVAQNWNQGDRATRTTEFAQDKMEQLLALSFADAATNTAVYPPTTTGGTGLAAGGGITSGAPVTGYVDYVDNTGSVQATAATALYIRQWSVAVNAAGNLKTITVVARALTSISGAGIAPSATLVCTRSLIQ
jgi:Tfp pilus assembly protein PilV